MTGFCEIADVREALLERSFSGALDTTNTDTVESTIWSVSDWLARRTNGHWYDSGGQSNDLVGTSAASATNVRLDVPSSPHRQDRQLFRDGRGVRYPTTTNGPYAKVRLPHPYVQTVTALKVRNRGGGVEDWVAEPDKTEGRGEEYYIESPGQRSYGQTYLYIHARSIGARVDYSGLLTLDYDYGLDAQTEAWQDLRRGVALASAAQLVIDDNVVTAIPDSGSLVGVDTQRQQLVDDAAKHLDPYLEVSVA